MHIYGLPCTFPPRFVLLLFLLHLVHLSGGSLPPKVFAGAPLAAGSNPSSQHNTRSSAPPAASLTGLPAWQAAHEPRSSPTSSSRAHSVAHLLPAPSHASLEGPSVGGLPFSPLIISLFHWDPSLPSFQRKDTLFILEPCSR